VDLDGQFARAALEASGWKGRAGTAISCSSDTERFYWHIARAFDAAGTLRISELSLDGELAAMALSTLGLARHIYRQQLRPPLRAAYVSARRAGMPDLRTIKKVPRSTV
jgi:hypothetical protein